MSKQHVEATDNTTQLSCLLLRHVAGVDEALAYQLPWAPAGFFQYGQIRDLGTKVPQWVQRWGPGGNLQGAKTPEADDRL